MTSHPTESTDQKRELFLSRSSNSYFANDVTSYDYFTEPPLDGLLVGGGNTYHLPETVEKALQAGYEVRLVAITDGMRDTKFKNAYPLSDEAKQIVSETIRRVRATTDEKSGQ